MEFIEITAQIFGILGLIFSVLSYQEKRNNRFFIKQGLSGMMFFINFLLIGAISAALFNLTNLVRSVLYKNKEKKLWKLITVVVLYTICLGVSLYYISGNTLQIFLSVLTYLSLEVMAVLMWQGEGKKIRYGQFFVLSPAWLIHNIFNFSLGGILCEVFLMVSVVVSFIRFGKDGFEK